MSGLTTGSQACFAIASYNSSGASKFSDWGCINLANPGGTVTVPPETTLSCDGVVTLNTKKGVSFKIAAGASNAGRLLTFELYSNGAWYKLGAVRVDATGVALLKSKSVPFKNIGTYPIHALQGSRFICEGDLNVLKTLVAFKSK